MIRTLLDLGATASINTQQAFWGSPLMNLACRDDADPVSFELLVGAGARVDEVVEQEDEQVGEGDGWEGCGRAKSGRTTAWV